MGKWLADNLKHTHSVSVFDRRSGLCENIEGITPILHLAQLEKISPELLINAVSIQDTLAAFDSATPYLSSDCILADVASVKGPIPNYYANGTFRFVSVHPMFGPTFANVDELKEENVIIIRESDPVGAQFFRGLFRNLGLNIYEYSFAEHDYMIAYSLTLPFASTLVFAACMHSAAVPGTTFKKHHNIAKGLLAEDDYLLTEILFNPFSLAQLEKVTGRLEFLKHVIKGRDFEEAKRFIDRVRSNIA
jgi:prephenate dehydrogenase